MLFWLLYTSSHYLTLWLCSRLLHAIIPKQNRRNSTQFATLLHHCPAPTTATDAQLSFVDRLDKTSQELQTAIATETEATPRPPTNHIGWRTSARSKPGTTKTIRGTSTTPRSITLVINIITSDQLHLHYSSTTHSVNAEYLVSLPSRAYIAEAKIMTKSKSSQKQMQKQKLKGSTKASAKSMKAAKTSSSAMKTKRHPDAPRRFKPAFVYYLQQAHAAVRQKLEAEGLKSGMTDVSRVVSTQFKSLSPQEKRHWEDLAAQDKERYDVEMSLYDGPMKIEVPARKRKDPDAPKRPVSAYLAYANGIRGEVKKLHPELDAKGISRLLSKKWSALPAHVSNKYRDEVAKKYAVYNQKMAEFNAHKHEREELKRREQEANTKQLVEARRREVASAAAAAAAAAVVVGAAKPDAINSSTARAVTPSSANDASARTVQVLPLNSNCPMVTDVTKPTYHSAYKTLRCGLPASSFSHGSASSEWMPLTGGSVESNAATAATTKTETTGAATATATMCATGNDAAAAIKLESTTREDAPAPLPTLEDLFIDVPSPGRGNILSSALPMRSSPFFDSPSSTKSHAIYRSIDSFGKTDAHAFGMDPVAQGHDFPTKNCLSPRRHVYRPAIQDHDDFGTFARSNYFAESTAFPIRESQYRTFDHANVGYSARPYPLSPARVTPRFPPPQQQQQQQQHCHRHHHHQMEYGSQRFTEPRMNFPSFRSTFDYTK